MIVLRKARGLQIARLAALLLALVLPLASLASCSQPAPLFESLNLGIPAAALHSPVVGPLPDTTKLHVGISFKIAPQTMNLVGQQPLRPGQSSGLERFARSLGISDATYQKIAGFFNAQGLVLQLSKLRTYLSLQAKAGTFARLLQTKFVMHRYNGRRFYAPATAPKIPSFLAVYFQGEWGAVGGTSAAAPIWAAAQALVNEDTIRHMGTFAYSPQLYYKVADQNGGGNAYFDITSGNNLYYPATPGWDFATGLGTPDLANFDQAVSNMLATSNGSVK